MIRSLKRKLIVTNMIIVLIMTTAAFALIYFQAARTYYEESVDAMNKAVQVPFDANVPFGVGEGKREAPGVTVFYVTVGDDGELGSLIGRDIEINDEDAFAQIVRECASSGKSVGVVNSENLRYMNTENRFFGRVVAFSDITLEKQRLSVLLLTCTIIGAAMLAVFLFISFVFAEWAVRPIKRSVEKQNRFIADASHELKTPITVILANADIISSHPDASVRDEEKWLSYIKNEAEGMKTLVSDMLTLARSDADPETAKAEFTRVDISEAVESTVLAFEPVAFENGKTFDYDVAPGLFVNGAESALKRLAAILIDNAVKYSDDGGKIEVRLFSSGSKITLSVADTGEPIPEDRAARLFDRFYRLDDARARQTGGFGLGLAIAKDIADRHGAKISCDAAPDGRTTFSVTFKSA